MRLTTSILGAMALGLCLSQAYAQTPLQFEAPKKIDMPVTDEEEDLNPFITADGSMLFFTRSYHLKTGHTNGMEICASKRNGEKWDAPTTDFPHNTKHDNSIVGISKDGSRVYMLHTFEQKGKKHTAKPGVSYADKNGGTWSEVKNVELPELKMNPESRFYGIYVSPDEKYMLLSMNLVGSLGEEDLYVSKKGTDGVWGNPVHLGATINTKGFEMSPYLNEDGSVLYFSSNGHKGSLGDADIYMSKRLDDTWQNWSTPVNMGAPINSSAFDAFFTVDNKGEAFFVSNREHKGSKIYYAAKKKEEVVVKKDPPKIDTIPVIKKDPPVIDPPKVAPQSKMSNFAVDSYKLDEASKAQLDEAAQHLTRDKELKLSLAGHCDSSGSNEYNQKLSEKRANAAKDYLVSKGVDASRISVQAFGEEKPVAENDTADNKAKNRRVEIVFSY